VPAITPPGPRGLPVAGNLIELGRDPLTFFTRCAREYGDMVRYRVPRVTAYLLNRPEYIEYVLVSGRENFVKGRALQATRSLVGDGLLSSDGPRWLRYRRIVQPAFHRSRVAQLGQMMAARAEKMLEQWQSGQSRDVHTDLNVLTQQIATEFLFGTDVGDMSGDVQRTFREGQEAYQARFRTAFLLPESIPTPGNLRRRRVARQLDEIMNRLTAERRRLPGTGYDALSLLLAARDEGGRPLPPRELRNQTLTLFLAGHDTVTAALTFACYLLARTPRVQEALYAELHAVLSGCPPQVSDLPQLPHLAMAVKEALRLYPPAWLIPRTAVADCEIGGYTVHAGQSVALSPWVTHRDPRYFVNPNEFEPERWAGDRANDSPRFAYFPFGAGPRACIGEAMAMQELCLVIAAIVQRFHLRPADDRPMQLSAAITLHPKHGVRLHLERRG
jgi:cytochrome P450